MFIYFILFYFFKLISFMLLMICCFSFDLLAGLIDIELKNAVYLGKSY